MSEGPVYQPIPDDASRVRVIAAIVAAVALLALLVGGSWYVFGRNRQPEAQQPGSFTPVQVPDSGVPTLSADATSSAPSTKSADPTATPAPSPGVPKVAFRLGRTLYLAKQDGSDPVSIVPAAEGPYAPSPDGRYLAWVDSASNKLTIAGPGIDPIVISAPAAAVRPVWLHDSSGVLFRRAESSSTLAPQVMRASIQPGSTPYTIGSALLFSAGPAGWTAIGPQGEEGQAARQVEVIEGATRSPITAPGAVSGLAMGKGRLYLGVREPTSSVGVWAVDADGGNLKQLTSGLPKGETGAITDLMLSPDGKMLVFTVSGDDGYSRMYVVSTGGGTPTKLSIRRDDYPLIWSSDSKSILFIEGNKFQGEATALMRVAPDGSKRFSVVTGATL